MGQAAIVVDYHLGGGAPGNPGGTIPGVAVGCITVAGPGSTSIGAFPNALHFGNGARLTASPDASAFDPQRFKVRLVMRATAPIAGRANLFEATLPACSLHLMPPDGSGSFRIVGNVDNARNGWAGVDTADSLDLRIGTWYFVDLVYDLDTLSLFVDGSLVTACPFPDGTLVPATTSELVLGVHPDLVRWPFEGDIALLQIYNGVPEGDEWQVDRVRGDAEWRIRLKENELRPDFDLGARQGGIGFDGESGMRLQRFEHATIGYRPDLPGAYVIYGAIRDRWEAAGVARRLGALVADEADARAEGSRRSVFEKGAIYWSPETGAWELFDRAYIDYEQLGGSASVVGLPVAAQEELPGGAMQRFDRGRLYLKSGATRAFEVHGAILERYLATGGPGAWGFPISDEEDVLRAGTFRRDPPSTGARQSRFEACTFFWSAATGAHEVHGDILAAYRSVNGPGLPNDDEYNGLGLPITDGADLPSWAGIGQFNAFEHGSIVFDGTASRICPAFRLGIGLAQTQEAEGWGQGQNDLYFEIVLQCNGVAVERRRVPEHGSFGGDNSHDLDLLLDYLVVPNDPELRITLTVDVWDEDGAFGGGDDHLGTFTKELSIANGWGLFESESGVFSANFGKVDRLDWQVQPRQPPRAPRDFWETGNHATPSIDYSQYAAAFVDVDDDPEWTDPSDWAQRAYFALAIEDAATGGNCFGLCTEALYAWMGRGYGTPLARFKAPDWELVRNAVNIKHLYQVGSDVLGHLHDQKEDGMTPAAIFRETRRRYLAGEPSVIAMHSGAGYTGYGHAVLPFAWDDSQTPWIVHAFDPNTRNAPALVRIDGDRFSFTTGGLDVSGSMVFVPWSALDHRQCSPIWDPNLLLLALLFVVVGADATTVGMTDSAGDNLWLPRNPRVDPSSGRGQFAPIVALDGRWKGEILMRRVRPALLAGFDIGHALDLRLSELVERSQAFVQGEPRTRAPGALPPELARALSRAELGPSLERLTLREWLHAAESPNVGSRAPIAHGASAVDASGPGKVRGVLRDFALQSSRTGPDFCHELVGRRDGRFDHLTRWRLTETRMRCAIEGGERHRVEASGLSGRMPVYGLTTQRDKRVAIEHTVRLGRSAAFARLRIANLPVRSGLPLNIAVGGGLCCLEVVTAGERVDAAIELETWRGAQRTISRFVAPMEGGLRLAPALHVPGAAMKVARIDSLFARALATDLLKPV